MPSTPRGIVDGFVAAWNEHDAGALAALFTDDADFVNVTGLWFRGRARIEEAHAYGFERIFGASTMRVGNVKERKLSDVAAVLHARAYVTGQWQPDGSSADERRTVFTFVVQRQPNAAQSDHDSPDFSEPVWLAVAAQNTDIPPGGMETHVNDAGDQTPTRYR